MQTETVMESAFENVGRTSPRKKLDGVLAKGTKLARKNLDDAVGFIRARAREDSDILWALAEPVLDAAIRSALRAWAGEHKQTIAKYAPDPIQAPTKRTVAVMGAVGRVIAASVLDNMTDMGKPWRQCSKQELTALRGRHGHMAAFADLLSGPMPEVGIVGDYWDDQDGARLWQKAAELSE